MTIYAGCNKATCPCPHSGDCVLGFIDRLEHEYHRGPGDSRWYPRVVACPTCLPGQRLTTVADWEAELDGLAARGLIRWVAAPRTPARTNAAWRDDRDTWAAVRVAHRQAQAAGDTRHLQLWLDETGLRPHGQEA